MLSVCGSDCVLMFDLDISSGPASDILDGEVQIESFGVSVRLFVFTGLCEAPMLDF